MSGNQRDAQLSQGAERMRRSRELRRRGFVGWIGLPIRRDEVEALVRDRFLAAEHVNDLDEIASAVGRLLDCALR